MIYIDTGLISKELDYTTFPVPVKGQRMVLTEEQLETHISLLRTQSAFNKS